MGTKAAGNSATAASRNSSTSLFSVPVGDDYRLLFCAPSTGMVAETFRSHEDDNKSLK